MSVLEALCKEAEIKASSVHLGFADEGEWGADRFLVTLERGGVKIEVNFSMGIGNRIVERSGSVPYDLRKYAGKQIPFGINPSIRSRLLPYTKHLNPTAIQVIAVALLDASCAQGTFEDFCDMCGYDTDSRKALEMYLACQENGSKLRKLLGNSYDTFMENNDY